MLLFTFSLFPCSLCILQRSRAGGTTTRTECTCSTPTATTTRTWRRSSPTPPLWTTARSLTDWNPPPTTWTFMLARGGLRTGRSSTPARLTPGCRPADVPVVTIKHLLDAGGGGGRVSTLQQRQRSSSAQKKNLMNYFSWTWLYKCVCFKVDVRVLDEGVQPSDGRWNDGMMERVPKKEIKECFSFFYYIFLFRRGRWNHAGALLRDEPGHYRDGTCVLLCLDVSLISFMKLLASDSMVKGVSHVSKGLRKGSRGGICMCWSQNGSWTHICKKNKTKDELKKHCTLMMLDCTEGSSCICT